jgi:hypothetical protein
VNCNYWLHKIKIIDSPVCRFCKEIETIEHFFFHCKVTNEFWSAFLTWWNALEIPKLQGLHECDVLLGFPHIFNEEKALNCCLLIAKWCIYRCKSQNKQPNIYLFHCELNHFLRVEKNIAIKNNKQDNFFMEWDILL